MRRPNARVGARWVAEENANQVWVEMANHGRIAFIEVANIFTLLSPMPW